MELAQLVCLCYRTAGEGAQKALSRAGSPPAAITRAQAYRRYGRSNVDRWITEGLMQPGSKNPSAGNYLNRLTLERIAAASNRTTYLPVAER